MEERGGQRESQGSLIFFLSGVWGMKFLSSVEMYIVGVALPPTCHIHCQTTNAGGTTTRDREGEGGHSPKGVKIFSPAGNWEDFMDSIKCELG